MNQLYKDYIRYQLKKSCNTDFSSKCLLQCVYCIRQAYQADYGAMGRNKVKISGDMPFEDFQKIGKTFQQMHLCGQISDPIYHPHLLQYLRYASDNNIQIQVHTNGTGKSNQYWKDIYSIKKRMRFIFGIDGIDQKTVNLHRVGQNFHQSFKAMLLGSQSHHKITWQFIPFRHNEHQIERAKTIAHKHNIQFLILKSNRTDNRDIFLHNKKTYLDWIRPPKDPNLSADGKARHIKQYM